MLQAITSTSGPGVALAGVEAPGGGEIRIGDDSRQPGLPAGEQVAELGVDGLDREISLACQ